MTDSEPPASNVVPPTRRQWLPLAAVAVLAVVIGGVLLKPGSPPQETPGSSLPQRPPTSPPPVAELSLGTSRSAGAVFEVSVPRDAPALQLRVRLDPADRFDVYALELRSPGGQVVWRGDELAAAADTAELAVTATVPARGLVDGTYELAVRGGFDATALDELGFVTLKLRRAP